MENLFNVSGIVALACFALVLIVLMWTAFVASVNKPHFGEFTRKFWFGGKKKPFVALLVILTLTIIMAIIVSLTMSYTDMDTLYGIGFGIALFVAVFCVGVAVIQLVLIAKFNKIKTQLANR